jgi:GST-like protein
MPDLSDYPITKKWPAEHPDKIQLYSLPTPNGVKISIMLEETGLPYEPHLVRFENNDQLSPEFVSLNPNNKIPAIIDPHGPDGRPLPLFESGAILIYLADKARSLILQDAPGRYETIQWLMFQMSGVGPMFGQVGFFNKFAGKDYEWIMGDAYTIADIATFPWINVLNTFYEAGDLTGLAHYEHVMRGLDAFLARPAVIRGLDIPKRPKTA